MVLLFQDYFDEASMCQDEMEQVMELSERLMPTLDPNDKETLRQMLNNTNQRLNTVVASSNRKQQLMEQKAVEWKDYQVRTSVYSSVCVSVCPSEQSGG